MSDLHPPDSHFFSAAVGWMELGLFRESRDELARMSDAARGQPAVKEFESHLLTLHWEGLATEKRWEDALEVAGELLELDQDQPTGWINRSYALHELRRTAEAHESLLEALPRFPELGIFPYNLACYACQMGRFDEARGWLRQAIQCDGRALVLERARSDQDLAPLLDELDRL